MTKLYCKVGDLAITVRAEVPENLGRIVHIVKPLGIRPWSDFGEMHLWWAEVLPGSSSQLHYLQPSGAIEQKSQGPVPDSFLRPLTPPEGLSSVADWLRIQCARPVDIAQGVAMYCDYQNALRRAHDAN